MINLNILEKKIKGKVSYLIKNKFKEKKILIINLA